MYKKLSCELGISVKFFGVGKSYPWGPSKKSDGFRSGKILYMKVSETIWIVEIIDGAAESLGMPLCCINTKLSKSVFFFSKIILIRFYTFWSSKQAGWWRMTLFDYKRWLVFIVVVYIETYLNPLKYFTLSNDRRVNDYRESPRQLRVKSLR